MSAKSDEAHDPNVRSVDVDELLGIKDAEEIEKTRREWHREKKEVPRGAQE